MAAHSSWAALPSIIIVEILSYLSLTDRLAASGICRRWRECLYHPLLWKSMSFRVKYGSRRKAKHLAEMCGKFVREALLEFNSACSADVRDCLKILDILSTNVNLERFVFRPQSCHIEWPERDPEQATFVCMERLLQLVCNARHLKHISLGCVGELTDHTDQLLPLLASRQARSLEVLHIASVKEDPDNYGLIDLPVMDLTGLHHLQELGIDYDYLSSDLLEAFAVPRRACLRKLVIHVHGLDPYAQPISNSTWRHVVHTNPKLEVTLNLIHSIDGAERLLDILQPALPLAHLRLFFCQNINMAAIDFVVRHMPGTLRSCHIIDGMTDYTANFYDNDSDEDPFVMMAWKCSKLSSFALIGYAISRDDVIAMARLRGSELESLIIPQCCITTVTEDEEVFNYSYDQELSDEVSRCLGVAWEPVSDYDLHPAIVDPLANAETAYLHLLLQDQA